MMKGLTWAAVVGFWVLVLIGLMFPEVVLGAERQCGDRDTLVRTLEARYGQHRFAGALDRADNLMEIFVNPLGGWSVVVTMPGTLSCVVMTGSEFGILRGAGG